MWHDQEGPRPYQNDLGLSIIHTPGHTPDSVAWYDNYEMHLSCGDSFYEEGVDGMPITFPKEGNLIEWVFSMQKLAVFVRSENARAEREAEELSGDEGWLEVAKRVVVSCAHSTSKIDGGEILAALEKFAARVFGGEVPIVKEGMYFGEQFCRWRDPDDSKDDGYKMSLQAPMRLMTEARKFFGLEVGDRKASIRKGYVRVVPVF